MLRRALFDRPARRDEIEDAFRWRGEGVSRLENLSDIVFAFAISFLVAGADLPSTFDELAATMLDFVAVGLCFALLLFVWYVHYLFFRRYGLEDGRTVVLNALLLFVILFYVYPLRFLVGFQADFLLGRLAGAEVSRVLSFEQVPWLQAIYSGGYAAVFGLFALLYRHALSRADALGLSDAERLMTRHRVESGLIHVGVALTAIAIGFVVPAVYSPLSGLVYFALWPILARADRANRHRLAGLTGAG